LEVEGDLERSNRTQKEKERNKMTGFKAYRRKGGDIQAQVLDSEFEIGDEKFPAGNYLVNNGGLLEGAHKAEFEAAYEPVGKGGGGVKKPLTEEQRKAKSEKMAATKAANKAAKEQAAQAGQTQG